MGLFNIETTWAEQGARENWKAAADAISHAHQPGVTGVCVSCVSHAYRDPIYGRLVRHKHMMSLALKFVNIFSLSSLVLPRWALACVISLILYFL